MGRGDEPATRWLGWQRALAHVAIVIVFVLSALGYAPFRQQRAAAARPQQAGQPIDPYATAAHIAGARADLLVGDARGAEAHVNAVANDMLRSARVPDVSRPIDHEAARTAVRALEGVRSAIWLDAANFIVMVDGADRRSMATIDRVCRALDPLGDTLAVVVGVQDATAKTPDAATTLSRNCRLPQGQLAFLQAKRQVDVVAPELRSTFRKQQLAQ
jgi:hypothetical protein